jgi:uncharacterized membrane protein YraQ (UPF0718 family)/copper chaperone CopZ
MEIIIQFLHDFILILGEMAPYLLLGFFFAGLLKAFMPQKQIHRYLNGNSWASSFYAALMGVPLPLCSCGVIPTGAALYQNGASKGSTVSFLISTPQTGVDSILATYALMGLPMALIRPITSFITGIFGGVITHRATKNEPDAQRMQTVQETPADLSLKERFKLLFTYGFVHFIQHVSTWLIIGLIMAALISALLPHDFWGIMHWPPLLQMLLVLLVSIPLYICATGSIPLAAVLMLKGLSPGAAFILLMAGPATNAATITMIGKVMGRRSLFSYLATIIGGALFMGLAIDYVFPSAWFLPQLSSVAIAHQHGEMGLSWWHILSAALLTLFIINGYIRSYRERQKEKQMINPTNTMETARIKVSGMTCSHCKMNVERNVSQLPFVDDVRVDLVHDMVYVYGEKINREKVTQLIDSLGYKAEP